MITALVYLLVMLLVAGVVFLLASLVFGRGEELEPLPPGVSPTRLPARDIHGDDVTQVRFQLVLRGYKMSEVDWVVQRLGAELDELRARIAELEGEDAGADFDDDELAEAFGRLRRGGELDSAGAADPDAEAAEDETARERLVRAAELRKRFAEERAEEDGA